MKRKYRLFKRKGTSSAALLSLLLAFLLLAGCSPSVPAPSQSPEPFSESHPAASLSYLQVEAEQVLTAESAAMVIYPEEGTVIREIPEGTLLTVLAAAASENQEWLLIRMRDLRSPSNLIGWVKKGKTLAYDESITLKPPYSMSSFTIYDFATPFICFCFLFRPPISKVRSPTRKSDTGEVTGSSTTRN